MPSRAEGRPTFVDLFCGAGGLSLGLFNAGWECVKALDCWPDAIRTYNLNVDRGHLGETASARHRAEQLDIHDLRGETLRKSVSETPDWVVGGPPCQGYSTVGKRIPEDPRNELFLEFRRVVAELNPEGFLIENVLGLKDMSFEQAVKSSFESLGYQVGFAVLTAADFGVPQLRRRVVFVGHRTRGGFLFPSSVVLPDEYTTVSDAIGDLPEVRPGKTVRIYDREPSTPYQKMLRDGHDELQGHTASQHPPHLVKAISFIPDGGNRRDIPDRYQPASGYHNSYSRLASWRPAVAVTSNMSKPSATRCIHPFQNRGLTAREGARLQSFPDRFYFCGGGVSQRLQIANAVPPLLARCLGEALEDPHRWR
jgi:DNA (cytosine-5)-methyltransferase 1